MKAWQPLLAFLILGSTFGGVALATHAVHWGFNEGQAPLPIPDDAPLAADCGECHEEQHAGWAKSRHKAAWTNDLMLAGYAVETQDFCIHCHAPAPRQKAEITANRDFYLSLNPRSDIKVGTVTKRPEPHARDGVDCAACHVRDGVVLATEKTFGAPHPVRESAELTDGTLCIGCHDFRMPTFEDGQFRLSNTMMQATGAEWRAWQAAGGKQSCVDCHMTRGDHNVWGVHDRKRLRRSLRTSIKRTAEHRILSLQTAGVGHHLPSGDLFRHLTVEAEVDGTWQTLAWIGRTFSVEHTPTGPRKSLMDDTSLRPGEVREIALPRRGPWRVVWHDGSAHDELRGLLDPTAIVYTVVEGK